MKKLVEPIGQFKYQPPVFDLETVLAVIPVISAKHIRCKGILSIYYEKIRYRSEPPLESKIKVHVIDLVIVLNETCEEEFIGKSKIKSGSYKKKLCTFIW
jgi:hypothetical protein